MLVVLLVASGQHLWMRMWMCMSMHLDAPVDLANGWMRCGGEGLSRAYHTKLYGGASVLLRPDPTCR